MTNRLNMAWTGLALVLASLHPGLPAGADDARKGGFESAFKDLEGDDQVSFVQTVNRSMAKDEDKLDDRRIQTLYRVNRDAIRGAVEADRKNVLAEVFATAPVKCLPYFTDMLAKEVFSRKAAGFGEKDEKFVEFASAALVRISGRCRWADNLPAFRSLFAVIMFLKASEGQPEDLRESFMVFIHSGLHEQARKEWLPAAMGDDGKPPSYKEMMEAGFRREVPDHRIKVGAVDPAELMNLAVHSDFAVEHDAWDVQSPTPRGPSWMEPPGGTMRAGLWRTPVPPESPTKSEAHGCSCGPGPYFGQTL